jgi:hypothetical protein
VIIFCTILTKSGLEIIVEKAIRDVGSKFGRKNYADDLALINKQHYIEVLSKSIDDFQKQSAPVPVKSGTLLSQVMAPKVVKSFTSDPSWTEFLSPMAQRGEILTESSTKTTKDRRDSG